MAAAFSVCHRMSLFGSSPSLATRLTAVRPADCTLRPLRTVAARNRVASGPARRRQQDARALSQAAPATAEQSHVPISEDILNTIVRPYQSQEPALPRILPEVVVNAPTIVTQKDPVPFVKGIIDRTKLSKVTKIQALVNSWLTGKPFGIIELDKRIFGAEPRPDILHRVVVWQHNMMRSGTANTQTRGSARGSNRKIRPQKGSGMARLGHRRSPMLAKGGRAFGPKPRNPTTKIQRKVVELGKRVALSAKYAQRQMLVVDSLSMPTSETAVLRKALADNGLTGRMVLLVYGNEEPEVNLIQAALPYRRVLPIAARDVDVFNILKYDTVVLDTDAVVVLEEMLGKHLK
ncbi:ribosomal protein L4 domain-containing protein [Hyaloraphidium curvatum]|nr:ribosomal protein L4 domain-containing protein [Hyaloraphidium curvatum]